MTHKTLYKATEIQFNLVQQQHFAINKQQKADTIDKTMTDNHNFTCQLQISLSSEENAFNLYSSCTNYFLYIYKSSLEFRSHKNPILIRTKEKKHHHWTEPNHKTKNLKPLGSSHAHNHRNNKNLTTVQCPQSTSKTMVMVPLSLFKVNDVCLKWT